MKQIHKQFFLLIAFTLCISPLFGTHIIGGNMTYRCLGNDRYEFTLLLFRDCNCFNCADFDQNVGIGVYRCGNNVNCNLQNQSNSLFTISTPLVSRSTIINPVIPGFQLPEQCLQRGTYVFTLTLPPSNENYYVAYQRCCRPETVTNIPDSRNVGMTIFSKVQSNAAASCNNGPVFQESISPVFCLGETLEIDHSAMDTDGDSLVYSICSAYIGAGLAGGPEMPGTNPNACNGIIPTPACPPPYNFVNYASGFSGTNPLGADSQLNINPQTGLITVNSTIAGQFLVTICVEEYRHGVSINSSFREFTYLASACQTTTTTDNLNKNTLKIFPNPANNFIQLHIEHSGISSNQIQIFNSFGQLVESLNHVENQKLDVSNWPEGFYSLILLRDGHIVQVEKFVKF